MNIAMPTGLGAVLAIVLVVLAILLAVHVLPFTAVVVGLLLLLAGASRLC